LTLGAGGQEGHFRSYGIELGSPAERFRRLRETVTVLRGIWTSPPFTFEGTTMKVKAAEAPPRPVNGTIPIFIGAGQPQMLAYTGRTADGWLKNGGWPASLDEYHGMLAQLEAGAEKAGRDPAGIRRALNGSAMLAPSRATAEERLQAASGGRNLSRGGLLGSVEEILESVATYRGAGVDTFHLQFSPEDTATQIRRFGAEVLPKARAI
jgi:alkanesulfonate monooxygenase SsuD/methylene tetrahydromethanopterin reductase-like flavin-dependent oxidoreductase (luciferase family)